MYAACLWCLLQAAMPSPWLESVRSLYVVLVDIWRNNPGLVSRPCSATICVLANILGISGIRALARGSHTERARAHTMCRALDEDVQLLLMNRHGYWTKSDVNTLVNFMFLQFRAIFPDPRDSSHTFLYQVMSTHSRYIGQTCAKRKVHGGLSGGCIRFSEHERGFRQYLRGTMSKGDPDYGRYRTLRQNCDIIFAFFLVCAYSAAAVLHETTRTHTAQL